MPDEGAHRDDLRAFAKLVDALAPWLDQVVIIGGWAHQWHGNKNMKTGVIAI